MGMQCSGSFMAAAGALVIGGAHAQQIYRVPSQIGTIQAAIQTARDGDTVLVARGVYMESLDFLGRNIRVVSEDGPAVTALDGGRVRSLVSFVRGETRQAVLEGFTVRNGRASAAAGAIRIQSSSPSLIGNVIRDNVACANGAGVLIAGGSPLLRGNRFENNRQTGCAGGLGGGVAVTAPGAALLAGNVFESNLADEGGGVALIDAGAPTLIDNAFRGNAATGAGGAILVANLSDPVIAQNTFIANRAGRSGGAVSWLVPNGRRGPILANNTFVDNDCSNGSSLFADGFDAAALIANNIMVGSLPAQTVLVVGRFGDMLLPVIRGNDVLALAGRGYGGLAPDLTGIAGNIAVDPQFENQRSGDFRLLFGSRCVDAGFPGVPSLPVQDPEGDDRVIDGDGDGSAVIDIGADEFSPLRRFGQGCAGSGGFIPRIAGLGGVPSRGNLAFAVGLDQALAPTDAILFLGGSDQSWLGVPLPYSLRGLGLPGCALQVSIDVTLALQTLGAGPGQGTAAQPLGVPNDPNLRGMFVFTQWWVVDPGPGPAPAALSAGLRIQIL
jgi:hypothetical protein